MASLSKPPRSRLQAGFTMIEILVAVLVLAVGLLGLAGLQTMGLRATTGSYIRTQAVAVAQELAERMRLNKIDPTTSAAYPYDGLVDTTCNNAVLPANPTVTDIATTDMDELVCAASSNFNLSTTDNAATPAIDERGLNVVCTQPPAACDAQTTRIISLSWQEVGLTGQLETKSVQIELIP